VSRGAAILSKLKTDHSGADDQQMPRHFFKRQRAGRGHDPFLVDGNSLELRHIGAGSYDDRLGLQYGARPTGCLHFDLTGRRDPADPIMGLDLVLAEQERHAFDVAFDTLILEPEHGRKVESRCSDFDAHFGKGMSGLVEQLGGVKHRLGRNAPDIETGAAEGFLLLDHRDLHTELRRANRTDVTAGASADDDEIVGGHIN